MKKRSRKLQNLSIRVKLVNEGACIQVVAIDHVTDTTFIQVVPLFVEEPEVKAETVNTDETEETVENTDSNELEPDTEEVADND